MKKMQSKHYPNIGETLFSAELPNGLRLRVVPKPGFRSFYAVFATHYGGAHRRFQLDGRAVDTPAGVASDLRSLTDSQGELEGYYLSQALDGDGCSPLELAELVENVSKDGLVRIANSVECDLIYFLEGNGDTEEDDEDDAE